MNKSAYLIPAVVVVLLVLYNSIFVVDEREKALVLQFGQIRQVQETPGIGFMVPFIQEVVKYDDRILSLDTEEIEVTPSDDRRLVVDAFARYRIANVVRFREAVGAGSASDFMRTAENRLSSILNAQIREVLGADQVTSDTILSADRRVLMNRIRDQARDEALSLGLDVVDVRLKMTNLPAQNLDETFARMRAEREREAADEIARGQEAALRVTALADRTAVETVSAANREAQIIYGEAEATANATFAEAYGADLEFFEFYFSLQQYQLALQGANSTFVLTPDSEFFDYLASPLGRGTATPASAEAPDASGAEAEPATVGPDAGDAATPDAAEEATTDGTGADAEAADDAEDAAPDAATVGPDADAEADPEADAATGAEAPAVNP